MPTAETLSRLLAEGFPLIDCSVYRVVEASTASVTVARTTAAVDLRPGGIVSGPVLMDLADTATWLHAIARHGESARASVTSDLTMHFLAPAVGNLVAVCTHEAASKGRDRFTVHVHASGNVVAIAHVGYAIRHDPA
jgi:acyl-coenzyme A thioesterase PaaI-like protein